MYAWWIPWTESERTDHQSIDDKSGTIGCVNSEITCVIGNLFGIQFTFDRFADHENKKCARFISKCIGCLIRKERIRLRRIGTAD